MYDRDYNFFPDQQHYQSGGFDFGPNAVDRIFSSIGQTVRGVRDVIDTITGDDSRRSNGYNYVPPYPNSYPQYGSAPTPGYVGYGWGDIPAAQFMSNNTNMSGGYPGIWNPMYGNGGNIR